MIKNKSPSWVPVEFIKYIEIFRKVYADCEYQIKSNCIEDIYSQLATNQLNSKFLWEQLSNLKDLRFEHFIRALVRGLEFKPNNLEQMTKANRKKHRAQVSSTAQKLTNLIEDTPYEYILDGLASTLASSIINQLKEHGINLPEVVESGIYLDCFNYSSIVPSLRHFQHLNEYDIWQSTGEYPVVLNKPGDRDANRAYFAQVLTNFFVGIEGRPERESVKLLCLLFFPSLQEFSDSDMRRIAPFPSKL
jgi:hypothetical protein